MDLRTLVLRVVIQEATDITRPRFACKEISGSYNSIQFKINSVTGDSICSCMPQDVFHMTNTYASNTMMEIGMDLDQNPAQKKVARMLVLADL